MPKSRWNPPGRVEAARRAPRPARPCAAAEDDLLREVAAALANDEPLALLAVASSILAALAVRPNPFERQPQSDLPSMDQLVAPFLGIDLVEASALLTAIAVLSGDEPLRHRVSGEVARRAHTLPQWLVDLHLARPADRAVEVGHVLRDGDNVLLGVQLARGHNLTAVAKVDHNLGTLVRDAFVVAEPLTTMIERMQAASDPDTTVTDLDPADARARVNAAIAVSWMAWPPFETESWPACRPLLEWILRMLPGGGTGYQRPVWDTEARDGLAERFFGSPFGADLDDPDHRALLVGSLLWFATDYGPGDPMRWSPAAVEIVMADWIPRNIIADADQLAKVPGLLRPFIRFCHHERGLRPALTDQTLAAVDRHEPEYQRTIRSPRPPGPGALLTATSTENFDNPSSEL